MTDWHVHIGQSLILSKVEAEIFFTPPPAQRLLLFPELHPESFEEFLPLFRESFYAVTVIFFCKSRTFCSGRPMHSAYNIVVEKGSFSGKIIKNLKKTKRLGKISLNLGNNPENLGNNPMTQFFRVLQF